MTEVHHVLFTLPPGTRRTLLLYLAGGGTSAIAASLAMIATVLRRAGHRVITHYDVADVAERGTRAFAATAADVILEADAVVLPPGWEDCPHALASRDLAECFAVPVVEWSPDPVPA